METLGSMEHEENFPYPVNIGREDFIDVASFDADEFLFKNHRYTSLDSLLSDLRSLSKSLNQDLLDLVNNEYTNFIELGQSIGSCLELIDNLSVEVRKFKGSLGQTLADFAESSATSAAVLQHKRSLNLLKNKIKLILLLHEQCVSFETLLGLDLADVSPHRLERKLHTLTTLHLSIGKMYSLIAVSSEDTSPTEACEAEATKENGGFSHDNNGKSGEEVSSNSSLAASSTRSANGEICHFFDHVVKTKVVALNHEFKSYLDELLSMFKAKPQTYHSLILSVLQTYRVLGMSAEAVRALKNKN